jgi:hypothetical protein
MKRNEMSVPFLTQKDRKTERQKDRKKDRKENEMKLYECPFFDSDRQSNVASIAPYINCEKKYLKLSAKEK